MNGTGSALEMAEDRKLNFDSSAGSSSSSSSSGSSSSSEEEGSSSSSSECNRRSQLWQLDGIGYHILVKCAENEAKLYKHRFARGSIGKCVWFREKWITPNEFQAISGRQSSKDWKRSIRLRGRCLKDYISEGLFEEHSKLCTCNICQGEDKDLRRQEGALALATKRRKLSQAGAESSQGGLGPSHMNCRKQSLSENEIVGNMESDEFIGKEGSDGDSSDQERVKAGVKRKRGTFSRKSGRVWSPSGGILNIVFLP